MVVDVFGAFKNGPAAVDPTLALGADPILLKAIG
jgi:hypothetical protein